MNFISSVASAAFRNSAQSRKGSGKRSSIHETSSAKMSDSSDSEIEPSDECDLTEDRKDSRSDSDSITSISRSNKRTVKKLYRPSLGSKEKSTDRGTDMSEESHKPEIHKPDKLDSHKSEVHKSEIHKTESSSNTSSTERKLPSIGEMVQNAILHLKDRKGSSAEAIRKYVVSTYDLDEGKYSPYVKRYLRKAVNSGDLVQYRGQGGNGAFKLSQALKQQHKKFDQYTAGSYLRHSIGTRPSRVPARNFSMIHSFKPNPKNQFKSSRFKGDHSKGIINRPSSRRIVSFVTPVGHRQMKAPKGIRQISKNVVKRGRPSNRDRHSKLGDPSVRFGGKQKKDTPAPSTKNRAKSRNS